ncbi:MAG: hypothetical protein RR320_01855 [Oscillospiraceae bacterium]
MNFRTAGAIPSPNELTHRLLQDRIPALVSLVAMLTPAILVRILGLMGQRKDLVFGHASYLYLSLFMMTAALWRIADSSVPELFFGYQDSQYFLTTKKAMGQSHCFFI